LLGRDGFLRAVRLHIDRAGTGHGGLLLITGEAGIGKTSLTGYAMQEARRQGMAVLRGSCWGADGTPGYWPWTQVIRGLRRTARAEAWKAASDSAGAAWQVLMGGAAKAAEETEQFQLFDAVTALLITAAQHQPLLIVLEDVHWADPASVALLEFAAQHMALEPALIVATCRDAEIERPDHPLRDRLRALMSRTTTLALTGLGTADVAELMQRTVGRAPDDRLVAEVLGRTAGNPFFVQEAARLWADGHELTEMSASLHAALQQRLGLLDDAVVACLGAASVLGRRFRTETLAHRAREHVRARRKRFEPVDAATTAQITGQFMAAAATGDLEGLLSLLAPNAVWTADSGGKATAARRPVVGAEKVAGLLMSIFRMERLSDPRIEVVNCNNTPAMVVYSGDRPEGVFLAEIIGRKITSVYAIRNPDKLVAVAVPRQISR
jgi:ketosteroid isomerase-like protein